MDAADAVLHQELIEAMRKSFAGLALSDSDEDKRTWQARVDTLRAFSMNVYGEEITADLERQGRDAAAVTIDSFSASLAVGIYDRQVGRDE